MARVQVMWTYEMDIIYVPGFMEKDIFEYQSNFRQWVDGVNFDGGDGTSFDTNDFIDYLNDIMQENSGEKAYIIEENCEQTARDKKVKTIYF